MPKVGLAHRSKSLFINAEATRPIHETSEVRYFRMGIPTTVNNFFLFVLLLLRFVVSGSAAPTLLSFVFFSCFVTADYLTALPSKLLVEIILKANEDLVFTLLNI